MWFSSKVHKGRRKEKRITPCRQGRPGPCRRPAQRPGGLWSWTCRRPAGCPAVREWLLVDPRRDPDRRGHVHLHLHLGRRNRHDRAVRRGLWWWRWEWNHEFKNKKATESGEEEKKKKIFIYLTSCNSSSWPPAEHDSSPATSHGTTVAATSAHHQPTNSSAASHGNPHGDPLPCATQRHHFISDHRVFIGMNRCFLRCCRVKFGLYW